MCKFLETQKLITQKEVKNLSRSRGTEKAFQSLSWKMAQTKMAVQLFSSKHLRGSQQWVYQLFQEVEQGIFPAPSLRLYFLDTKAIPNHNRRRNHGSVFLTIIGTKNWTKFQEIESSHIFKWWWFTLTKENLSQELKADAASNTNQGYALHH